MLAKSSVIESLAARSVRADARFMGLLSPMRTSEIAFALFAIRYSSTFFGFLRLNFLCFIICFRGVISLEMAALFFCDLSQY